MSVMMTEAKAKKLWCPMVRAAHTGGDGQWGGGNGGDIDNAGAGLCKASGCMMWRTAERSKEVGYCGLAGFPQ